MNAIDYFNARLEATISPMDFLKAKRIAPEKYLLLDVRNGPTELRNIIIEDAKVCPEAEIHNWIQDIPKEREIVVYCWDVWCNTASKVAKYLLERNYEVKELAGGIAAWKEMKFPVSSIHKQTNGSLPEICDC